MSEEIKDGGDRWCEERGLVPRAQRTSQALCHPLVWYETFDEFGNSIWKADSAFISGPNQSPFQWRLVQSIRDNRITWECASDEELVGDGEMFCPTLAEARAACQEANDGIRAECGGEVDCEERDLSVVREEAAEIEERLVLEIREVGR